jgi:hypothetical protein
VQVGGVVAGVPLENQFSLLGNQVQQDEQMLQQEILNVCKNPVSENNNNNTESNIEVDAASPGLKGPQPRMYTYEEAELEHRDSGCWPEWFIKWEAGSLSDESILEIARKNGCALFNVKITAHDGEEFPRINYEMLKASITFTGFFDDLIEFRQMSNKVISLNLSTIAAVKHILQAQRMLCNTRFSASLSRAGIAKNYVITGFMPGISAASIAAELNKINISPSAVRLWTRKTQRNHNDTDFEGRELVSKADIMIIGPAPGTGLIHVAKQVVKITIKKPPLIQCVTCLRYGHRFCQRKQKCDTCGKAGHTSGSQGCTKIVTCGNCGKAHNAQSKDCPHRKREIVVLNKIHTQGVTRNAAIQETFTKPPNTGSTSQFPPLSTGITQNNKQAELNPGPSYAKVTQQQTANLPIYQDSIDIQAIIKMEINKMRKEIEATMNHNFQIIIESNTKMMQEAIHSLMSQMLHKLPQLVQQSFANLAPNLQQQTFATQENSMRRLSEFSFLNYDAPVSTLNPQFGKIQTGSSVFQDAVKNHHNPSHITINSLTAEKHKQDGGTE